jgi:type IV pilus assembly protein PilB
MANFTRQTTRRLGEILLEEKLVTVTQLQEALKRQYTTGELLGEALVNLKIVTETDIARVIARQFGYPYFNAAKYDIPGEALALIPVDVAIEHQIIPLDRIGDVLLLAVAGVVPAEVLDGLARRTRLHLFVCISTASQILEALKKNGSRLLETIKHNYETKTQ